MDIKKLIIKLSNPLSKTISVIFLTAGLLNLFFNNSEFGFEGNILINAVILFVGYSVAKTLDKAIDGQITDEFDKAVSKILLWFNSFMFLIAGIYSLAIGTIPDEIGIPMVISVIISSAVLLYVLWRWRWFR